MECGLAGSALHNICDIRHKVNFGYFGTHSKVRRPVRSKNAPNGKITVRSHYGRTKVYYRVRTEPTIWLSGSVVSSREVSKQVSTEKRVRNFGLVRMIWALGIAVSTKLIPCTAFPRPVLHTSKMIQHIQSNQGSQEGRLPPKRRVSPRQA